MFPRVHSVHNVPISRVFKFQALLVLIACVYGAAIAGEADEPRVLVEKRVEQVSGAGADSAAKTTGAFIDYLEINERPLKQVLDYLSTVSGKNIRTKKPKD